MTNTGIMTSGPDGTTNMKATAGKWRFSIAGDPEIRAEPRFVTREINSEAPRPEEVVFTIRPTTYVARVRVQDQRGEGLEGYEINVQYEPLDDSGGGVDTT